MAEKFSRNEACPCGSGLKYKRCCLPLHDAARAGTRDAGDIDELSNAVNDHIRAGRFTAAEAGCAELAKRFPDQVDYLSRQGELREAQGRFAESALEFRKAASFARAIGGFGPEGVQAFLDDADRSDRKARG